MGIDPITFSNTCGWCGKVCDNYLDKIEHMNVCKNNAILNYKRSKAGYKGKEDERKAG